MKRLLLPLLALCALSVCLPTTASAAPKKAKFEVTFKGYWGVDWYVRMEDEEPHHVCLAGIGANGESDFEAWTKNNRKVTATLYADPRKGSAFGHLPIETALERKLTMGQAHPGCTEEYGKAASELDCDNGSPQWGRFNNPPAYLDIAAGRGRVGVGVTRYEEEELIAQVWDWCPFWGNYEGKIGNEAKLSSKKLFSGKPVTVKGTTRMDYPGGGGNHEQEGYQEWKMTIRYVKPKKG